MTFHARLTELLEKAWPTPWEYKDGWLCEPDTPYRHRHFAKVNPENAELIAYLVNHAEAIRDLVVAVSDEHGGNHHEPECPICVALAKLEEA